MARYRRPLLVLLAWLAAAFLLWYALRETPFTQIISLLSRLAAWQVFALILVNLVILLLMALRWSLLLRALGGSVPLAAVAAYRIAALGVSYFTPGPQFGGEPVQVHLLQRRHAVPLAIAVSSVLLDRLVDLLANFTFLAAGVLLILFTGLSKSMGGNALVGPALLVLFPMAHLAALASGRRPASRLLNRMGRNFPLLGKIAQIVEQAEEKIAGFLRQHPLEFMWMVLLACVTWLVMVLEFWLMASFLLGPVSLVESVSAQTAARMAFLLPLPAGLGALEASQVMAAEMLGWAPADGLALSLLIRARDVITGLVGLWLGGAAYQSALAGRGLPALSEPVKPKEQEVLK